MDCIIKEFNELTLNELYEIIKLRLEVFVCEQKVTIENDLDEIDKESFHLFIKENEKIIAYLRIIPKGVQKEYVTFGRVAVLKEYRRRGFATQLIKEAVHYIKNNLKEKEIIISAQEQAKNVYLNCGFIIISDLYNEAGIPHLKMKLSIDNIRALY
ncbi:MAG: GNAT family N-acetyltransferase [Clostridiales bacterium]|nr:GNAT family N-acetyltransferase [Clostridiales bacterium]